MDLGLKGKVALVTAASRGLGRAVASELAREDARVMISSRQPRDRGLLAVIGRRRGDVKALVSHTVDRFGGVDILVNNTGGPPAGGFDDFGDEAWRKAFESILMSLIRAVREVLPFMRDRGHGRIVNIASSSVKQPIDNLILSNTFRAGLAGLAKSLSFELAPYGILVNTLGPGRISTERSASIDESAAQAQGVSVEEIRGRVEEQIPLGRYGTPAELARVAAFLASPANGYVTGQAILVDGGMVKAL